MKYKIKDFDINIFLNFNNILPSILWRNTGLWHDIQQHIVNTKAKIGSAQGEKS